MSQFVFGIYGYDFCQNTEIKGIQLIPKFRDYSELKKRVKDPETLWLTGWGILPEGACKNLSSWVELVWLLSNGMTFCTQRAVLTSKLFEVDLGDNLDFITQECLRRSKFEPLIGVKVIHLW